VRKCVTRSNEVPEVSALLPARGKWMLSTDKSASTLPFSPQLISNVLYTSLDSIEGSLLVFFTYLA
jgi:hypothetical protein